MIIVGLTESSGRFIAGLIIFIVGAVFVGWLSDATGMNPLIVLGVLVLLFVGFIALILRAGAGQRTSGSKRRCAFIRANGLQCIQGKMNGSEFCQRHDGKAKS